jgi:hypothetical protein
LAFDIALRDNGTGTWDTSLSGGTEVACAAPTALVLSAFAPRANLQINGAAPTALAVSTFAPTVTVAAAGVTVEPTTAALVASAFAPQANLQINGAAPTALVLSTFAPTAVAPRLVTPATAPLALSTFAPSVNVGAIATPTTAALVIGTSSLLYGSSSGDMDPSSDPQSTAEVTLAAFRRYSVSAAFDLELQPSGGGAPLDTADGTVEADVVTDGTTATILSQSTTYNTGSPGTVTLDLLGSDLRVIVNGWGGSLIRQLTPTTLSAVVAFRPEVNLGIIPSPASLTLSTFAPSSGQGVGAEPTTAALTLSTFAPTIALPRVLTPDTAVVTVYPLAPTVGTTAHALATPATAALAGSTFAPTVTATAAATATPSTAALVLSALAPAVGLGVIPPTAALAVSTFAPTATAAANTTARPSTAALVLLTFVPDVDPYRAPPEMPFRHRSKRNRFEMPSRFKRRLM